MSVEEIGTLLRSMLPQLSVTGLSLDFGFSIRVFLYRTRISLHSGLEVARHVKDNASQSLLMILQLLIDVESSNSHHICVRSRS